MESRPFKVVVCEDSRGRAPYCDWLDSLSDKRAVALVEVRVRRARLGSLGHWESVGGGVFEMKIDYGPGYRVYFGRLGQTLVILLCGGEKGTQSQDILKAKLLWVDYKEHGRGKEE